MLYTGRLCEDKMKKKKINKWLVYQLIDFSSIREIFQKKRTLKIEEKNTKNYYVYSASIVYKLLFFLPQCYRAVYLY